MQTGTPGPCVQERTWPWAAALVVLALIVSFLPMVLGKTIVDKPEASDIGPQWISFAAFIGRTYRGLHFPLWDQHDLCGMPFLAFPHTGSLYPASVIAYVFARSYPVAATFDIFIHLCLASIGVLALLRRRGRSAAGSFVLALAYAYSGFMFPNINFPPSLHTGAWLPLLFAGAWGIMDRPRLGPSALAALALMAMLHGGDLEMTAYAVMGLLFEAVLRAREGRLSARALAALLVMLTVGGLAALAQVLPSFELIHGSVRSQGMITPGFEKAALFLPAIVAFRFFVPPGAFQQIPFGGLYYLGALTAVLAAATILTPGPERRRLLIVPAFLAYLVIMYVPPFNSVAHRVPMLGALIVPFRALPILSLFVLLAVSSSLDRWIAAGPAGPPAGKWGAVYFIAAGVSLPATALAGGFSGWYLPLATALFVSGGAYFIPAGRRLLARPGARAGFAVLIALFDVYGGALISEPRTDPRILKADPRVESILANTANRSRYLIISGYGILDSGLPFHLGMRINADTIDAYTRVPPAGSALRLARLYPSLLHYQGKDLVQYDQLGLRDPKNLDLAAAPMLNDLNVVWIVSRFPWKDPIPGLELKPAESWPGLYLYIYENRAAKPRAWVATPGGLQPGLVNRPAPDRIVIDPADFSQGVYGRDLHLSESYDPGWKADTGGLPVPVRPDDLDLMVLPGAGGKRVTLRYLPASFRVGLWGALGSLAALGLVFIRKSIYGPRR